MGKAERQQKRVALGWQAVERGDLRSAEAMAMEALRKASRDVELLNLLGTSLFLQGRFQEALAPLREVFQKAPARGAGYQLGQCHLALGDPQNASVVLEREVRAYPDFVEAHNLLGIALIQQGRHEEALSSFASAIRCDPRSAGTHNNLGNALLALARHEQAIPHFRKAIELQRDFSQAHNNLGHAYRGLRRHEQAVECYEEALRIAPDDFEVHNNLGTVLADLGRHEKAADCYRRALTINPGHAPAYNNLGLVLEALGRHEESVSAFKQALAIEPDSPNVLTNLGVAYQKQKRLDEAISCHRKAIAVAPDYAGAHTNLGLAYAELKRFDEAIACHQQAISIKPDYPQAHSSLGLAYRKQKRFDEAIACHERALAINPEYVDALADLGLVYQDQKRFDDAVKCYMKALSMEPDHFETRNRLGVVYWEQNRPEEAVACYEKALSIRPDTAEVLVNLGVAYQFQRRLAEAAVCLQRAISLKPELADAHYNLGTVLSDLKRHDEAIGCFERALAINPDHRYAFGSLLQNESAVCRWEKFAARIDTLGILIREGLSVISPLVLLAVSQKLEEQRLCAEHFVSELPPRPVPLWQGERYGHEKIRIAYLSADFREHPVAYCIGELFGLHDRSRFEIIGVSFGPDEGSEMRSRLTASFDRFFDVRTKDDFQAASLIRDLEVDIAIDLMGHTRDSRPGIFAFRPAPVQAAYLGFAGTVGADFIDYLIADRFVIPEEDRRHYSEQVVYLPDTFMVNHSRRLIAEPIPQRAQLGLPENAFVFCCFSNSNKLTPGVFDVWMRLLQKVEGSVLWLSLGNAAVETNLRKEAARRGVDPRRLVFATFVKKIEEHYARYRLADLFLDTAYNGHTTTTDALWAGLPVLTCTGKSYAGRVAGSLLHAVGLPELVTHSLDEYEALALKLSGDRDLLDTLRTRLEQNKRSAPLFDTDRFRRHIESAYATMWEIGQRGEKPRAFSVDPSHGQL